MTMKRILVTKKELKELGVPYSHSHIARLEADGKFPKRIRFGQGRVAYYFDEVMKWITDHAANRDEADNSF